MAMGYVTGKYQQQEIDVEREKLGNQRRGQDLAFESEAAKNPATGIDSANRLERMNALGKSLNGVDVLASSQPAQGGLSLVAPSAGQVAGSSVSAARPAIPPTLGLGALPSPFDAQDLTKPLALGMKKGGAVQGPSGVDRVPAKGPNGEDIRLNKDEYILVPEVVAALGGVEALDDLTERLTGERPVPGGVPMPPLPEQMAGPDALVRKDGARGFAGGGAPDYSDPRFDPYRYLSGDPALEKSRSTGLPDRPGQARETISRLDGSTAPAPAGKETPWIVRAIDRNTPRAQQAAGEMIRDLDAAPTVGTAIHEAGKGAVKTLYGAAKDLVSPAVGGLYDFGKEVVTGRSSQTSSKPQQPVGGAQAAAPQARAIAQAMTQPQQPQPQPSTEQGLLDDLSGVPGTLTRQGKVFRYEDPTAMRGAQAPASGPAREVVPGQPLRRQQPADPRAENAWGWKVGPASASAMRAEASRYDHLPISGVTYSDSVEGANLGARAPVKINGPAAAGLTQLYQRDAWQRAEVATKMGLPDAGLSLLDRPVVTEAEQAQQAGLRRSAQQELGLQQLGRMATATDGKRAKAADQPTLFDLSKEFKLGGDADSGPSARHTNLARQISQALQARGAEAGAADYDALAQTQSLPNMAQIEEQAAALAGKKATAAQLAAARELVWAELLTPLYEAYPELSPMGRR